MIKKVVNFIAVLLFILSVFFVSAPSTHACLCAVQGSPDFTLCDTEPGHIECNNAVNTYYACCYTPPADSDFCQQSNCPAPTPTPIPIPCPPGQCTRLDECETGNIDFTRTCSGLFVCCSATAVPTFTPGPAPTIIVCTPPDNDPDCGGHVQPCCCATAYGDCDSPADPSDPPLHCGDTGGGVYRCCLEEDTEPGCWTDPSVTGIPPGSDTTEIFCEHNNPASGIRTAIGCINASAPKILIGQIFAWALRISSGVLFLMLAYSGFLLITAAGNQKQAIQAKQILSTSITGFAIVVLSILILNLLGVSIFNLDVFGFRV